MPRPSTSQTAQSHICCHQHAHVNVYTYAAEVPHMPHTEEKARAHTQTLYRQSSHNHGRWHCKGLCMLWLMATGDWTLTHRHRRITPTHPPKQIGFLAHAWPGWTTGRWLNLPSLLWTMEKRSKCHFPGRHTDRVTLPNTQRPCATLPQCFFTESSREIYTHSLSS